MEKDTFKAALRKYHQLIRESMRKDQTEQIQAKSNSSKEIFAVVKDFSTPAIDGPTQDLCNDSNFLCSKITTIYSNFVPQPDPLNLTRSLPKKRR